MSTGNIWYLAGPFHRYEEDLNKLAQEKGLRIIDATATESREGAAESVPVVTVRGAKKATAPDDDIVAALKAKLDEAGVQYRANASRESLEKLAAEISAE